jgi:phosphomannomutase
MKAFKAYDIRGVYNRDFDKKDVYRIGFFLPGLLEAKEVLVGRDVRTSTEEIFTALCDGITDAGADVCDMGLATTPMVYFGTAHYGFSASVQITASHNPKEYNGLKVSRSGALPVGYESGLAELEKLIAEGQVTPAEKKGRVTSYEVRSDYLEFLSHYVPDGLEALNFSVDCSNGMASLVVKDLLGDRPHYLYDTLDGTFPNHEPNPLEEENVTDLKNAVRQRGDDLGIIFDGDADRVMFVDEQGRFIPPDLIIAVLGLYYLKREKGNVLQDIRTSRSVSEYIRNLGGTPHTWKVGHAYAKLKLREIGAVYGGELAGHYYFRDFHNCDSGLLAALLVLNVLLEQKRQGRRVSELIDEIKVYANSGEINYRIEEKRRAMEALKERFTAAEQPTALLDFDGYRIEYPSWWFNVRPSNTEPYLRLVVEAKTEEELQQRLQEIDSVLNEFRE